ncbi:MAG: NifU family protein [Chitinophagales bacterium]|nr:NifU family protein [Chitinophagales bacterium]
MNNSLEVDHQLLERVEASLDTLRPYLQRDGGNVEVVNITDDMILQVRLLGACEKCPQSFMTMKAGIEEAVKHAVPSLKAVVAV